MIDILDDLNEFGDLDEDDLLELGCSLTKPDAIVIADDDESTDEQPTSSSTLTTAQSSEDTMFDDIDDDDLLHLDGVLNQKPQEDARGQQPRTAPHSEPDSGDTVLGAQ